ncbi:MAG: IS982 family transposase [Terriglobia bacterium]
MDNEIETLAVALYVKVDDFVKEHPELVPFRPENGIPVTVSDAELIVMSVMGALLGYYSERKWLRRVKKDYLGMFPRQIGQSGYNKRLRKMAFLFMSAIRMLGMDTSLWTDDVWVVDSTPVPCGCSRETVTHSDLAGFAQYGYCASHSRFFWGLRLHLVCTLHGLPVMFALSGAKGDEREVLLGMIENDIDLVLRRPGQTLIGDKNYFGKLFEEAIADSGIRLLRPARKKEARRVGREYFKPFRQVIESVNWSLKSSLTLEEHGGRTDLGVFTRVLARVLALTAGIWFNDKTGQNEKRSLIAYDH